MTSPRPDHPGEASFRHANAGEAAATPWHRETLHRNLLVVMLAIALGPLAVASGLGYLQVRGLIHREELNDLRWHGERAVRGFGGYLESLTHDIIVTVNSNTIEELSDQAKLDRALSSLRTDHGALVDLSVIDPRGVQIAYAGPYALAGKSYGASPWYNRTLARKVYVSEVFMGFRNVPHFVVAVSKKEPSGPGSWVVRASIDAVDLDRFLGTVGWDALDDAFLVSEDGLLQSSSRHYGKLSDRFDLASLPAKKGIDITEAARDGTTVLRAAGLVPNTHWILVLEQTDYAEGRLWTMFKTQGLAVSIFTALVAGLVIVSVARSLADRIRSAEQAREALITTSEHTDKLASVGRLAAGVAHEVNNPLAIVAEKAGLMKDIVGMTPDMPHREKFLREIASLEDAVGRARTITHRLLGFARRMDSKLEPVQVNDVVRETVGFLDKEASYRDIGIEQDLDPGLPRIESDAGQLQQILLNVLNNAIDAVERGGRIRVATSEADGAVRIDVRDDGPGIPPEVLKKIFEPFFTTKTSGEKRGTGLGLSITYGLVKKLGGKIGVQSEVGSGTIFRVSFPIPAAGEKRADA